MEIFEDVDLTTNAKLVDASPGVASPSNLMEGNVGLEIGFTATPARGGEGEWDEFL